LLLNPDIVECLLPGQVKLQWHSRTYSGRHPSMWRSKWLPWVDLIDGRRQFGDGQDRLGSFDHHQCRSGARQSMMGLERTGRSRQRSGKYNSFDAARFIRSAYFSTFLLCGW